MNDANALQAQLRSQFDALAPVSVRANLRPSIGVSTDVFIELANGTRAFVMQATVVGYDARNDLQVRWLTGPRALGPTPSAPAPLPPARASSPGFVAPIPPERPSAPPLPPLRASSPGLAVQVPPVRPSAPPLPPARASSPGVAPLRPSAPAGPIPAAAPVPVPVPESPSPATSDVTGKLVVPAGLSLPVVASAAQTIPEAATTSELEAAEALKLALAASGNTAIDPPPGPAPVPLGAPAPPTGTVPVPADIDAYDQVASYQILKLLGGGGMAQVYLARSRLGGQVDKLVALKTVLPEFGPSTPLGSMFLEEARVSATLQHANIVQVFDYGEANGRPYMAMEYVLGQTVGKLLQRLLQQGRPPRSDVAVAIGIEVCRALEYMHARTALDGSSLNLVHRDVSPTNIMLSMQGEVKLLDFGIVATDSGGPVFSAGQAVGKFRYMSVEQARGEPPSPNWDLYALGVVLYELLTLRRLSKVTSAHELLELARSNADRRPSLVMPSLSPEVDEFIVKATALGHERFQNAGDMRKALVVLQEQVGACDLKSVVTEIFGDELKAEEMVTHQLVIEGRQRQTFPPKEKTGVPRPARNRKVLLALSPALVVAAVALVVWLATPAPAVRPEPKVAVVPVAPVSTEITASFASTPPGADVIEVETGRLLGRTPFSIKLPRAETERALRFELAEHTNVDKTVRLASDVAIDVAMPAREKPVAPKPDAVPRKKPTQKEVVKDGFVDPFAQ